MDGESIATFSTVYLVFWGLVCALLSALNPVISKPILKSGYHYATLLLVGSFFFGIGSIVFAFVCNQHVVRDLSRMDAQTLFLIAFVNLVCGFLGNMIFYHLLSHHHSNLVTAITATSPLFSFLIAYLYLSEPVSFLSFFGIFCIVGGTLLILKFN
jgi:drug/metabolite transporter (DMT)-like permease